MQEQIPPLSVSIQSSYSLEEVCDLLQLRPYMVRFWESEFLIDSIANSSGQKCFPHSSLMMFHALSHLLFTRKLSLEKVKSLMKDLDLTASLLIPQQEEFQIQQEQEQKQEPPPLPVDFILKQIQGHLEEGLEMISLLKNRYNWPVREYSNFRNDN